MFEDMDIQPEMEETEVEEINVLDGAREYALLFEKRKTLESEIDQIKSRMSAIESAIAEDMMLENPRIRVRVGEKSDGSPVFKTVHVTSIIRASHNGDKEALVEGIKEAGLDAMISETFNANTLSAFVRGLDPDKKLTPEELLDEIPLAMRPYIKLSKTISLGCKP